MHSLLFGRGQALSTGTLSYPYEHTPSIYCTSLLSFVNCCKWLCIFFAYFDEIYDCTRYTMLGNIFDNIDRIVYMPGRPAPYSNPHLPVHLKGKSLCCSAHKMFLMCVQIDNWNNLYLSIFPIGYSVIFCSLAPNFSFDPMFRKGDMGSLVHSRECGEATAVSVTSFHPDLVAEIGKYGSRRLNLRFLVL